MVVGEASGAGVAAAAVARVLVGRSRPDFLRAEASTLLRTWDAARRALPAGGAAGFPVRRGGAAAMVGRGRPGGRWSPDLRRFCVGTKFSRPWYKYHDRLEGLPLRINVGLRPPTKLVDRSKLRGVPQSHVV